MDPASFGTRYEYYEKGELSFSFFEMARIGRLESFMGVVGAFVFIDLESIRVQQRCLDLFLYYSPSSGRYSAAISPPPCSTNFLNPSIQAPKATTSFPPTLSLTTGANSP